MNHDEDEDRDEWDKAWREQPLRRLVNPPEINVMPTGDYAWGKVVSVDVAADPPQYVDSSLRGSGICPVCGEGTSSDCRIAATLYPYFEDGFSYGLPCRVHGPCLASCEEIPGPSPVPW